MEGPIPNHLYEGDCLEVMRQWPDGCVDHCIADPPFGIASGGGRRGKRGLGWAFSSHVTMEEAWDRFSKDEFFQFNVAWLSEVCRVVKPNGNILVFGTFHNIYQLGFILQNVLDRRVLNSIVWFKPNAQPNITARTLTESTEQVVWAVNNPPAKARKWTFNYWKAKELAGGKQMRNLWEIPYTPPSERKFGKVPSQKPEALLEQLVLVGTNEGDLIFDCFSGTGTTGVVAQRLERRWVMIEENPRYNEIALKRLGELKRRLTSTPEGDGT
jgi:site-specific DNA-methyltransferase (adenine-specific)